MALPVLVPVPEEELLLESDDVAVISVVLVEVPVLVEVAVALLVLDELEDLVLVSDPIEVEVAERELVDDAVGDSVVVLLLELLGEEVPDAVPVLHHVVVYSKLSYVCKGPLRSKPEPCKRRAIAGTPSARCSSRLSG